MPVTLNKSIRTGHVLNGIYHSYYWRENYTVVDIYENGFVTVIWHGNADVANPQDVRESTHCTPLDIKDKKLN